MSRPRSRLARLDSETERWQQRQPPLSITQRLGGHPATFLDTLPPGSAERAQRRHILDEQLKARRRQRH